jgi:hypothetical protein
MAGKLLNDGPMTSAEIEASKRALTGGKVVEAIPVVFFARMLAPVWSVISGMLKKGDATGEVKRIEAMVKENNPTVITLTPRTKGPPLLTTRPASPSMVAKMEKAPVTVLGSAGRLSAAARSMSRGKSTKPTPFREVQAAANKAFKGEGNKAKVGVAAIAAAGNGDKVRDSGRPSKDAPPQPKLVDQGGKTPYQDDSTPPRKVKASPTRKTSFSDDSAPPVAHDEQAGRKVIRDWFGDKTPVDYSTTNETMEEQNLRRGGPVKKKVSTPVKKKAGGAVKKAAGVAKSKYGMNKGGFTSRGGNYY